MGDKHVNDPAVDEARAADDLVDENNGLRNQIIQPEQFYGRQLPVEKDRASTDKSDSHLLEQSFDAVVIHRNFKIVYANPVCTRLLGAENPDDLVGMSLFKFIHPDYRRVIQQRISDLNRGNEIVPVNEEKFIRLDGEVVEAEVMAARTVFQGQPAIKAVLRDITRRKHAEEALRRSEERFRSIVENINDMVWEMDEHFTCTYASPRTYDIMGYEPEEVLGKKPFDFITPDDVGRIESAIALVFRERKPMELLEYKVRRKDGRVIYLETNGVPIFDSNREFKGYRGINRDITARMQAEKALRANEKFLNNILDGIQDGIGILDKDMNILRANHVLERWHTYASPLKGKKCYGAFHGRARPCEVCPSARAIDTGEVQCDIVPLHGEHGEQRGWLEIYAYPLKDEQGRTTGVIEHVRDITRRMLVEEEREITVGFLSLVNRSAGTRDLVRAATEFVQEKSGCEAVGIRLREGDDYPYYEYRGFRPEFVRIENSLCNLDKDGNVIRDSEGFPVLDCMCGNVITGRFDTRQPFFTDRGSFWTNSTTELLATTTENDRMARTRNVCNKEGYESFALIALRAGKERLGLLQLNDRRKGHFTPADIARWERLADYLAIALAKFRSEEALRESESRLKQTERIMLRSQEAGKVGSWCLDLRKNDLWWSPETYHLFGLPPGTSLSYEAFLGIVHPDDRTNIDRAWKAALAGTPYDIEHRVIVNGEVKWMHERAVLEYDEAGSPVSGIGTVLDITDRKRAERSLKLTQFTVDKAGDMVLWLAPDGRFVYVNEAACKTFGYTRTEMLSLRAFDTNPAFNEGNWAAHWKDIKDHGSFSFEASLRKKDGSFFPGEITVNYLVYEGKEYNCSFIRDITERKRAEDALMAAKAEAELYVDLMGHDISNMNQITMGFLELVHNIINYEGRLDSSHIDLLDKATASLQNSSQLIANVKKLRREKMGLYKPEIIDVGQMLADVVAGFQHVPGRDLLINYRPAEGLKVKANELLKDVFVNLIGNSIKHSTGHVTITVNAGKVPIGGLEYCRVAVEDDGPGIPDSLKDSLFSRLSLEATRAKGKGFGLCLIKLLVDDYQGRFLVEDRIPGDYRKGCRFIILLPMV